VGSGARRTQKERRESTVAKLLQATIDAVAAVGYARTTVKEICDRAGVSHGGLFRHFATREDLVVAAAEEVAQRQLGNVRKRLEGVTIDSDGGLLEALRVIRETSRSRDNVVFHELIVASRTNEGLAGKFAPAAANYYVQIYRLASELLGIESDPDRTFEMVLFAVVGIFDGETIGRRFYVDGDMEERRLRWMARVAEDTVRSLRE
jgi:AcrR family transcriptional regulator